MVTTAPFAMGGSSSISVIAVTIWPWLVTAKGWGEHFKRCLHRVFTIMCVANAVRPEKKKKKNCQPQAQKEAQG
jgi:hypothetical protein